MKILRRDFDITTFGAVLLFLCRAPFLSVRGEFSRCSDFSEAGRLVDGMYNLEVMPDIAISVYCKGTTELGLLRSTLFQGARALVFGSLGSRPSLPRSLVTSGEERVWNRVRGSQT